MMIIGGNRRWRRGVSHAGFVMLAAWALAGAPARAVVVISDGFGDADRNNDGAITVYDTDINVSGTLNDPVEDVELSDRGIVEVTAAMNPGDTGIVWSGTRSFDTAANLAKSNIKIINDSVATGTETAAELHNDGLALGVESRGGGSSFIGRFGQSVDVGPVAGDKVKVSVDFRYWREAANATPVPASFQELRWGLFEDTDNELGMSAPAGTGGASVVWGTDDGNFFARTPVGAEGDKGIYSRIEMGAGAFADNARINWEYNVAGINGTTNNGRFFEGSGVSDTPASGGDVGTVAAPFGDGPGGIIQGDLTTAVSVKLSMEIVRLEDGLVQVATFVNDVELLRDEIKTTDTGFGVIGPPAFSYDYVGFRNTADFDYVIDNFAVEIIGSNEPTPTNNADFNSDNVVDGRDFLIWQRGFGLTGETGKTNGNANADTVVDGLDYAAWKAKFGGAPAAAAGGAVPEPGAVVIALAGLLGVCGFVRREITRKVTAC